MSHPNRDPSYRVPEAEMHFSRRRLLGLLGALGVLVHSPFARGFGQVGHFSARRLLVGAASEPALGAGLERWGWELSRRTSAPARLDPVNVAADDPRLLDEPFVVWRAKEACAPLTSRERANLERFLRLGGLLVVDDAAPQSGGFLRSVRTELARVLIGSAPVRLPSTHVLFKAFYLLGRPTGRVEGPPQVEAIISGRSLQVLLLPCDLVGALAQKMNGEYQNAVVPGGEAQRERAIRFAVNIAMYVLCSDYKDDQVHAEWLMRRGARPSP